MFSINEPLVLADKKNYNVQAFEMHREQTGKWAGRLTLQLLDSNEQPIKTVVKVYRADQWNEFWAAFNSGKFLYQQGTGVHEIPDSIEDEFLNE
jgi:hypothetical protein